VPGRSRKWTLLCVAWATLGGVVLLPARRGAAQTVESRGPDQAGVDIALRGSITSSVAITVSGSIDQASGAVTTVIGTGIQGVVDFGTYDLAGPLINGEKQRVPANPKGNYLVATLRVTTIFTGGGASTAAVDIQRANPCGGPPDVSCAGAGSLFYAKMTPRKPNQRATWPKWSRYPETNAGVFVMPLSSYVPGAGNLDNLMANGESIDHQVAVWIPDAQLPGPFSTLVTYTVTRL
jgi:hypothetical protein